MILLANKITAANAGESYRFGVGEHWAARIAQFSR